MNPQGIHHIQHRYRAIRNRPFTATEATLFARLGPTREELVLARLMAIAPDADALRARIQPPLPEPAPHHYVPFTPSPALTAITTIMNDATANLLSGVDPAAPDLTFGAFSERVVASVPYVRQMLAQNLPGLEPHDAAVIEQLYESMTGRLQDTLAASVRGTLGKQR
jgi:hypothetical protein